MTNISDQAVNGNLVYYKSGNIINVKPGEKPDLEKTPCNVIITLDTINSFKTHRNSTKKHYISGLRSLADAGLPSSS